MANHFVPQWALGWELLLVLGMGVAVIVALAAAAGRWTVSTTWQAAIWRIATLSLFALFLFELTGLRQAVAELCRQHVFVASSGEQPAGSSEKAEMANRPMLPRHSFTQPKAPRRTTGRLGEMT